MAEDLGTARGTIEIDASSLGRASDSMKFMGDRMLLLGAAAVAGFGFAVKSAADFEAQLSRFSAVSDTNEKDLEKVRQKALQLGRDSAFGAKEVVEGFVEIGKAGLSAKEILEGVGDAAVYLAAAGELDMAAATETLVNVMQQFKLKGSDAVHIANILAGAANASTAEVDDLAVSMKYAGPVAAEFGISLEDTSAMLAIFANNGIKGSTAGTSMRSILLGLAAPTAKAEKTLKDLGIVTEDGANKFYGLDGKLRPLPEVMQTLQDATKGLSDKERIAALNTLFLRRALSSALIGTREGKTGFEEMRGEMTKVTAQEVMKEKLDNLNGALKILKASLETFAITIGEHFQEPIKKVADVLIRLTNRLAKVNPLILEIAAYALLAFGMFLLFGGVLFKTMQYTIQAYRAFKNLAEALQLVKLMAWQANASLLPLGAVFFIIVLALLLIGGVALLVYKQWDKIWGWIKEHPAYAAIIAILLLIISPFILLGFIIGALAKNWEVIWAKIQQYSAIAADKIKSVFNSVVEWFKTDFLNFFTNTLPTFLSQLPDKLWELAKQAAEKFMEGFHAIFDNFPEKISFVLGFILGNLVEWGFKLFEVVTKAFFDLLPIVVEWGIEMLFKIVGLGIDIIAAYSLWLLDMAIKTPGWLADITAKFVTWAVTEMIPAMVNLGIDMVREAGKWALDTGVELMQKLNSLPGEFLQLSLDMLKSFLEGFDLGIGGVWEFIMRIPITMRQLLLGAVSNLVEAGAALLQGFWDGAKEIAKKVANWAADFAKDIVKKITDPLGIWSPSRVMMGVGEDFMLGMQIGLDRQGQKVLDGLAKFGTQLAMPPGVFGQAASAGAGAVSNNTTNHSRSVTQNNVIQALDVRQAVRALERQQTWAEMTAGV